MAKIWGDRSAGWSVWTAALVAALALIGSVALMVSAYQAAAPPVVMIWALVLVVAVCAAASGFGFARASAERVRSRPRSAPVSRSLFDQSPNGLLHVARVDEDIWSIVEVNTAFTILVGGDPLDHRLRPITDLVFAADRVGVRRMLDVSPDRRLTWNPQTEVTLIRPDGANRQVIMTLLSISGRDLAAGSHYSEPGGGSTDLMIHVEDVTARRAAEEEIKRHKVYDSSTGLLSRDAFFHRVDAALHRQRSTEDRVTVLRLDIADLKRVNENFGLQSGDRLLSVLADRLRELLDESSSLARIAGDEFACMLPTELSRDQIAVFAGEIVAHVGREVLLEDVVRPRVCVGVATASDSRDTAEELMRRADLALFRAKLERKENEEKGGRGESRVEIYSEAMGTSARRAIDVRRELTQALLEDGLDIAAQPVVSMKDGSCVGYEALVRLRRGEGWVAPGEFLPVAKQQNLMDVIDAAVMRKAMAAVAEGRLPNPDVGIAINVEAGEVEDPSFARKVLSGLSDWHLDPEKLVLEFTESALLRIGNPVLENIQRLREFGVKIAMDDFGTGYSSLSQLRRLAIDILKIDRSFVTGMEDDPEAEAIVRAVINMSHDLGLMTIAEGVETKEQAEQLAALGCDQAQGYLFGRPEIVPFPRSPSNRIGASGVGTAPVAEPNPMPFPRVADATETAAQQRPRVIN